MELNCFIRKLRQEEIAEALSLTWNVSASELRKSERGLEEGEHKQ